MSQPPAEWTVLSMLEWATGYFDEKGIPQSRLSIEWILAHVLGVKRLDLYLMFDRPLSNEQLAELRPLVKRRATHEPLQYIVGETDFLTTTIKVRPGVLIPRPETEQLVEILLNQHPAHTQLSVLDIGTGSGCIPIALKKERPQWHAQGVDISNEALAIASENAAHNQVDVTFSYADLFNITTFPTKAFDIIVSNPPYILEHEKPELDAEVVNFEPSLALFCSSTENVYSAIQLVAMQLLPSGGHLFLELHERHGAEVLGIFPNPFWSAELVSDYSNKSRFLVAKKL